MDTVADTVDTQNGCQDCPPEATEREVVMRFETSNGFVSYAVDYEVFAQRVEDVWPVFREMVPPLFRPLLDGFLFSLRHGPIQRTAKENGLDANEYVKKPGRDKDAGAMRLLAYILFKRTRQEMLTPEGLLPLDVRQKDLADAYNGIIRRVPAYDALPSTDDDASPQLAAPGADEVTA